MARRSSRAALDNMPPTADHKDELVRAFGQLGIGPLELLASVRDEIVVLDRQRRAVFVLGDWSDQGAAVHRAAHARALQGEHVDYEWTRRKGRQLLRLATTASPIRDSTAVIVGVLLVTRHTRSSGRGGVRLAASIAQRARRLLELEEGVQQLAGAIENYRKHQQAPREFGGNSPLHHLSPRERQVLDLLGQGYRPRSIAEKLHVSPETVRNHLKAMFKKTGTHSQEELTAMWRAAAI